MKYIFLIFFTYCNSLNLLAQASMPATYPQYTQTGNPQQDDRNYAQAKEAWIKANPAEYAKVVQYAAQNAISYEVPTPKPAPKGDLVIGEKPIAAKQGEVSYEQREKDRRNYWEVKIATMQASMATQIVSNDAQEPMSMYALNPSIKITPYLESIFQRMKEGEFPGNMMQFDSDEQQKQARTTWIMQNADLYQLFVWATKSPDGKIYINKKEYEQASPSLKKEIDAATNNFVIAD